MQVPIDSKENTQTAQLTQVPSSNQYVNLARDIQEVISPLSTGIVMAMIGLAFVARWYMKEPGTAIKKTIESVELLQTSILANQQTLQKQSDVLISIGHNDIQIQTKISNLEVRLDNLLLSIEKTSAASSSKLDKIHDDFRDLFLALKEEVKKKDT